MQLLLILVSILFLAYSAILLIYRAYWMKMPEAPPPGNMPGSFISVIIPARNEEENIVAFNLAVKVSVIGRPANGIRFYF